MDFRRLFGMGRGGVDDAPIRGNRPFVRTYKCFSIAAAQKSQSALQKIEEGGKIILPQSALEDLANLSVRYPMLFELTNPVIKKRMHCGVLEFSAEEGMMYLPYWMMENLLLEESDLLRVTSVNLPLGTGVTIQPQSSAFLDISNPRAVLENKLRNLSALSKGDMIVVRYNNKVYHLAITELKPAEAVCIIETDLNVEFAPVPGSENQFRPSSISPTPSDPSNASSAQSTPPMSPGGSIKFGSSSFANDTQQLQRSSTPSSSQSKEQPKEDNCGFTSFGGTGYRLDGRSVDKPSFFSNQNVYGTTNGEGRDHMPMSGASRLLNPSPSSPTPQPQTQPPAKEEAEEEPRKKFVPFGGKGFTLGGV